MDLCVLPRGQGVCGQEAAERVAQVPALELPGGRGRPSRGTDGRRPRQRRGGEGLLGTLQAKAGESSGLPPDAS